MARFLHPAASAEVDSDSDSDQETRPRISEDGIVIKERKPQEKVSFLLLWPELWPEFLLLWSEYVINMSIDGSWLLIILFFHRI